MPQLRIPVKGDAALACYYVKGNWPNSATEPTLETTGPDLILAFDIESQIVRDFQDLLTTAIASNGRLSQSARRLKMLLATQLVGRVIPDHSRFPFGAATEAV